MRPPCRTQREDCLRAKRQDLVGSPNPWFYLQGGRLPALPRIFRDLLRATLCRALESLTLAPRICPLVPLLFIQANWAVFQSARRSFHHLEQVSVAGIVSRIAFASQGASWIRLFHSNVAPPIPMPSGISCCLRTVSS